MTVETWRAELVLDAHAKLGEGPIWSAAEGVLYWVDIERSLVHRYDPVGGGDDSVDAGELVGAVVPRAGGGLLLALQRGFAVTERWGDEPRTLTLVEADRDDLRMNDGACDTRGRYWGGTMCRFGEPAKGSVYRLDPDGAVTQMVTSVTCSNGVGWDAAGETMYYVDTGTNRVDAFDFDLEAGTITNRRPLVEIDSADGMPDGLVVDAEGCLWVALWDGWAVHRYTPDGTLVGAVGLPVGRVTKCAFGGPELTDLYITTAEPDSPDPEQPHAGGLFHVRPGVAGAPTTPFAG